MNRDTLTWLILGGVSLAILIGGGDVAVNLYLQSANAQKWAQYLSDAEDYYGIPKGLLTRIAEQESSFKSNVIDGTHPSPAGALGIMQLMPQFWDTVRRPIPFTDSDTQDQIGQAAEFLASLYHHFGNWTNAVAGYNAGQGTIDKVLAGQASLPAETSTYLASVFGDLPQYGSPNGLLA